MDPAQVNRRRVVRKDASIRKDHIDPQLFAMGNPSITNPLPRAPTQRAASPTSCEPDSNRPTAAAVPNMSSLPHPTPAGPAPARARPVLRDDGTAINGALRLPPSVERFRHAVPHASSVRQPLREVINAVPRPIRQSHRQAVPFTGTCNVCNMPGHTARACPTVFGGQSQRDIQGPAQRDMPASTVNVPAGRLMIAPQQRNPVYAIQPVVMGQGSFPMLRSGSFDTEWAAQYAPPVASRVPPHEVKTGPSTLPVADPAFASSPNPSAATNEPDTSVDHEHYAMSENLVQPRAASVPDQETTEEVAAPHLAGHAEQYPTPVSLNAGTPLPSDAGTPASFGAGISGSAHTPIDLDANTPAEFAADESNNPELEQPLVPGTRKRARFDTLGGEFDGEAQPDVKRARQVAPAPYPAPVPGPYPASYPAPAGYPVPAGYPAPAPIASAIPPAVVPPALPDINGPKYNLDHPQVRLPLSLTESDHRKNSAGRFLCAHTCRHVCSHACCRDGMAGDWKGKAKDIRKRRKAVENARKALLTQHPQLAQTPADREFVRGLPQQPQPQQPQPQQPQAIPQHGMQQQALQQQYQYQYQHQQHQQQQQHQVQHHQAYQPAQYQQPLQRQAQDQTQYQAQQYQYQYQYQQQYQDQYQYQQQPQYQYHHQYQAQRHQQQYQQQQQSHEPQQRETESDAQHLQRHDTDAISEDADNTTQTASNAHVANHALDPTMTDQRSPLTAVESDGSDGVLGEVAGAETNGEIEEDWHTLFVNNDIVEVEAPPSAAPKRKRSEDDDLETATSPAPVRKHSPRKKARLTAHDAAASRGLKQNEGSPGPKLVAPTVANEPTSPSTAQANPELLRLQAEISEKEEYLMLIGTDNKFLIKHWSKYIEDLQNALKLRKAALGLVEGTG